MDGNDVTPSEVLGDTDVPDRTLICTGICADHLARKSRLYSSNSRNGINDPHGIRTDPPHGGHIVGAEYLDRHAKWPLGVAVKVLGSNIIINYIIIIDQDLSVLRLQHYYKIICIQYYGIISIILQVG